ncbi:MAG: alpha/beta hydrolase [Clostridiales bacterium]|nr:alpha/beta hydrolase [Clostridiales bacterium]
MPSLISTILRGQIKLLNPIISGATLEQTRKGQDALAKLGTRAVEGSVAFHELRLPNFDAAWAIPLAGRVTQAIVYLHGGAYAAGGLDYAKGFGGLLAQATGRAVLCVGYRLAPEYPYPAALEDAVDSYREALLRYAPGDIALVGESAGGGLCYALALYLKEQGMELPARIVAVSPWTDLTMSREVAELEKLDPLLTREGLDHYAHLYAGRHDRQNPLISPLFGDLHGLPPSLIIAGSHEILLDDSRLLAERLRQAGCDCQLYVEEGLWHVYVLYPVPEAKEAMRMTVDYLAQDAPEHGGGQR